MWTLNTILSIFIGTGSTETKAHVAKVPPEPAIIRKTYQHLAAMVVLFVLNFAELVQFGLEVDNLNMYVYSTCEFVNGYT